MRCAPSSNTACPLLSKFGASFRVRRWIKWVNIARTPRVQLPSLFNRCHSIALICRFSNQQSLLNFDFGISDAWLWSMDFCCDVASPVGLWRVACPFQSWYRRRKPVSRSKTSASAKQANEKRNRSNLKMLELFESLNWVSSHKWLVILRHCTRSTVCPIKTDLQSGIRDGFDSPGKRQVKLAFPGFPAFPGTSRRLKP